MDTQLAFAFGMLAMVAIVMMAAIVVGMVKVIKHNKMFRIVHDDINGIHRHVTDIERNLYSELNELKRDLQAYTDSRADKLEQKLTSKKQLLKD